jgi:hypothetical protein
MAEKCTLLYVQETYRKPNNKSMRLNFIEVKDITPPDETLDYIKNLFNMK